MLDGCACLQARQYFKVTHDAIRSTGSQHLILGVKFSGQFDRPVAQAMPEFVDVASLDFYGDLKTAATDPRTLMHVRLRAPCAAACEADSVAVVSPCTACRAFRSLLESSLPVLPWMTMARRAARPVRSPHNRSVAHTFLLAAFHSKSTGVQLQYASVPLLNHFR